MTRRSYTVHHREGDQSAPLFAMHYPGYSRKFGELVDGDYTVRDCLGGLLMIVRVKDKAPTVIERTPRG